jgi:formate dehydrogenase major subunit
LTKPLYRAPFAKEWKEVSWDWALDKIAENIKKYRDISFLHKNEKGETVNRTDAIASIGSAALDNEECYLYQKFLRSLGLVYIEHQARI